MLKRDKNKTRKTFLHLFFLGFSRVSTVVTGDILVYASDIRIVL